MTASKENRRNSERMLRVLKAIRNVNRLIGQSKCREDLLQGTCDCLTEAPDYFNAWIALFDKKRQFTAGYESGIGDDFSRITERLKSGNPPPCVRRVLDSCQPWFMNVPEEDCAKCPLASSHSGRGGLSVGLIHEGHTYGVIHVSLPIEHAQASEESDFLTEMAVDIGYALNKLEQEKALQKTLKKLTKAYELTDQIVRHSPVAIVQVNLKGKIVEANEQAVKLLGLTKDTLLTRTYNDPEWRIRDTDGNPFPEEKLPFRRVLNSDEAVYNVRHTIESVEGKPVILNISGAPLHNAEGRVYRVVFTLQDVTLREEYEKNLNKIAWLLEKETPTRPDKRLPFYGDITELNTTRVIRDSITPEMLQLISADIMVLLDSSLVIYEKNGDYAFATFVSEWCALVNGASRRLCRIADNKQALVCGRWLCHNSSWNLAQAAMKSGRPADEACAGGMRIYSIPIRANDDIVGAISVGYGNPPTDGIRLTKLAETLDVDIDLLRQAAVNINPRPLFIVEAAKKRLLLIASQIGQMVETYRAYEVIKKSEVRYRKLVQNVPGMVYRGFADWSVKIISENHNVSGYTSEEINAREKGWLSVVHPDDREDLLNAGGMESDKARVHRAYRIIAKGGKIKWVDDYKTPIFSGGRFSRVEGVMFDISERKMAEASRRRSEGLFRGMFENMSSGVAIYEPTEDGKDFIFRAFNSAAERITRVKREEVLDQKLLDLFPHMDEKGLLGSLKKVFKTGETVHLSPFYYKDDQREGWRENTIYKLGSGQVVAIFEDVTEKYEALESLRASEKRYKRLSENSPAVVCQIQMSADGAVSIPFITESARKTLGVSAGEVMRDASSLINKMHYDCREAFEMALAQSARDMTDYRQELMIMNGENLVWVEARAIPDKQPDGTVIWDGFFQDITEQKKMREILVQNEKMDAVGQLAAGLAHDFNNTLTGVLGYGDLLVNRLDDPKLNRYAENICRSARHCADLTLKLLAFAQKGQFMSIPVDIHQTITDIVELLERSIDKRICLRKNLLARQTRVIGDPTMIKNALLNLGLNARDAMPEGGVLSFATDVLEVEAGTGDELDKGLQAGMYIVISVSDTGCGIPENVRPHIFEPFFTTKSTTKGSGMGLASVFGTVSYYKGHISVKSVRGAGTAFTMYLPLAASSPGQTAGKHASPATGHHLNVLVVDDEVMLRDLAVDILSTAGYNVLTAANGTEAVDLYRQQWRGIDVVVLDMIMPDMDGRDTFRKMKAINPKVNVILSSGYSLNDKVKTLIAQGASSFIQKPFDQSQLLTLIETVAADEDT